MTTLQKHSDGQNASASIGPNCFATLYTVT